MLAVEKIGHRHISNLIAGPCLEMIVNEDGIGQTESLLQRGDIHEIVHLINIHC